MEDIVVTEKQHADVIAQEYIDKGYEVSREISLDFFPGILVDILVKKDDETKVVEVKSRSSLAKNPAISELARMLHSRPGWSFELNLVSEREKLDAPEDIRPFGGDDIIRRIEEAERLIGLGSIEAALVLAWSASEATVRMLIEEEGISINRVTSQAYTLGTAVSEGVISRDDYDYLTDVMKYRNATVHGFSADGFTVELVSGLIETTRRLLQPIS